MKNLTSMLSITTVILLSIPFGKYISTTKTLNSKVLKLKNIIPEEIDYSLRNFHPNKGE